MNYNLAIYLDEPSEDPAVSCEIIKTHTNYVCLKKAWSTNITSLSGTASNILRDLLISNGLKVAVVCSDVGNIKLDDLETEFDALNRAIQQCSYFKCKYLRLGLGIWSDNISKAAYDKISAWMKHVSYQCLESNIIPVFETTEKYPAAALAILFKEHIHWQIIYDPANLIARRKIDPHAKYYSLLKKSVKFIDLHDYKTGYAPKAPGFGDAKLDLTINDAIASNFNGWYCLEQCATRRLEHRDKTKVFEECVAAALKLLNSV